MQQQNAATAPTGNDQIRPAQASELPQRPLTTAMPLDGKEMIHSQLRRMHASGEFVVVLSSQRGIWFLESVFVHPVGVTHSLVVEDVSLRAPGHCDEFQSF